MCQPGPMSQHIVKYVGGPLNGSSFIAPTEWTEDDLRTGGYIVVDGWEHRADYEPKPGQDPAAWCYRGPILA